MLSDLLRNVPDDPRIEILIVDDHSDYRLEVPQDLDHRAFRLHEPPAGERYAGAARNRGLKRQMGSGTVGIPGRPMPLLEFMKSGKRRADVQLAQWAHQQDAAMVVLPREAGWLRSNEQEETIYGTYTARMPKELSQEISSFAFKVPGAGNLWK